MGPDMSGLGLAGEQRCGMQNSSSQRTYFGIMFFGLFGCVRRALGDLDAIGGFGVSCISVKYERRVGA